MSKAPPYIAVHLGRQSLDVDGFTLEEEGAYWRLLRAIWQQGGAIRGDHQSIADTLELPLDRWLKMAQTVLKPFVVTRLMLTHRDLLATLEASEARSSKAREAGRMGGQAKARKLNGKSASKATKTASSNPSRLWLLREEEEREEVLQENNPLPLSLSEPSDISSSHNPIPQTPRAEDFE